MPRIKFTLRPFHSTLLALVIIMVGCATYYQKTEQFHTYVQQGKFNKADQLLQNDNRGNNGKNALLNYLNHGYVTWAQNQYQRSNSYFGKAEVLIEDYINNPGLEVLTYLSNPMIKPYKPEDFETVMVNYFMALNFIKQEKYSEAIVECKRINIKLNALNDKYPDHKNKYQRDAFAHMLMGLFYEANNDYNNAFIAYRNALEVYETDYKEYFNTDVPRQLQKDLLRTAYLTGFHDEVQFYEDKFNTNYQHKNAPYGEVVLLWMNGFGPVKGENSITFAKVPNSREGYITLVNQEYDLAYPFYIGNKSSDEQNALKDLRFFRVAFPKYMERKPIFSSAIAKNNGTTYPLQVAQNINAIAFKSLHDRMARELAQAIGRLATKKALEALADEQDENIGTLLNIVNTLTEKADTRNWQTLPYSISYTRIPLTEGDNCITLETFTPNGTKTTQQFHFQGQKGKTYFHPYHSIATRRVIDSYR
ncbi:MAG: COG3014 family protein [Bacteroidota bacterium]